MPSSATRALAAALIVSGLSLAACSPTLHVHGYMPPEADVARIRPGVSTMATVQETLGLPAGAGVMRDSAWYYVESTFENYTYHAPKVLDRKVLAVTYNQEGVVTGLARYGVKDGRIVDLANETTETGGQQLGVLQQLFGNILNMDGSQFQQQGVGTQTGAGL
ncbi:outer membrane protein assembly factor BamE [Amaricoccus solimangrovi]|nr:outer membrane protein assembly factor BamE [Amaricoccus solimangrovi]